MNLLLVVVLLELERVKARGLLRSSTTHHKGRGGLRTKKRGGGE